MPEEKIMKEIEKGKYSVADFKNDKWKSENKKEYLDQFKSGKRR